MLSMAVKPSMPLKVIFRSYLLWTCDIYFFTPGIKLFTFVKSASWGKKRFKTMSVGKISYPTPTVAAEKKVGNNSLRHEFLGMQRVKEI